MDQQTGAGQEYLDDVAFWSRALSDEEITSMYNDGVVNSTADPSRNDDLHTMQLTPNPASSSIEIAWTEYNGAHTKIDIVSLTGELVKIYLNYPLVSTLFDLFRTMSVQFALSSYRGDKRRDDQSLLSYRSDTHELML